MARMPAFGVMSVMALLTGCGNQMFRQPSYQPLDTPRAMAPAQSIPVELSKAPDDAGAIVSPAYGDQQLAAETAAPSSYPASENDLPPADVNDNAENVAPPRAVNSLRPPFMLSNAQVINGGSTLFLNRCVQCHNAGGYGYGVVGSYLVPHPPDLASQLVQKKPDGAIFWIVTMGQGKMPGFKTWTTPDERWALTAYVRSLKDARKGSSESAGHVSDTTAAPYPVYGEPGFESGKNTAAFKELGGAHTAAESRVYTDPSQPQELGDPGKN
jgi:hypothetical protein